MERASKNEVGRERGRNKRGKKGSGNNGRKEERGKRRGLERRELPLHFS